MSLKRKTKTQKLDDQFTAYQCMKNKRPVKRSRAKDGSVPTHPVVDVNGSSENQVLTACILWLKKHKIFCNRHECGGGMLDRYNSSYAIYGIKGAGDIIGLLPNGIHFEIECKAGKGGRLSAVQQKRMFNIQKNNGLYFIVHGLPELEYYFKGLI